MKKIKVKNNGIYKRILTNYNFNKSNAHLKGENLKQAIKHYKQDKNIYAFSIYNNLGVEVFNYNADIGETKNLLVF